MVLFLIQLNLRMQEYKSTRRYTHYKVSDTDYFLRAPKGLTKLYTYLHNFSCMSDNIMSAKYKLLLTVLDLYY